jgi:hypothetical protein
MGKIFAMNVVTFRIVAEIRASLPNHSERSLIQEPFILEDAIGRITPVHLQFIASWDAFDSVLEKRFQNVQGHEKVLSKDFVLQSTSQGGILCGPGHGKARSYPARE